MRPDAKPAVRWTVEHALPRQLVKLAARRGDLQSRMFFAAEQHPTDQLADLFAQLQARGPMVGSRLGFITADHDTVREVLSSSDVRTGFPAPEKGVLARVMQWSRFDALHPLRPPSLLATEPPDHTRYRKLVTRVFTARAVESLRERVQSIADELLDDLAGQMGSVDLAQQYCARLPVIVIAEILGVPAADHDRVLALGTGAAPSLDFGLSYAATRSVERSLIEFDDWLDGHIERLRRDPGSDLMSQLIAVRDEDGGLDDRELKSTAGLVLAAGFETTVNLMGNAIALLADHPDQLAALRDDPTWWPNAVDEVLRIDPPVLLTGRTTSCDTTIGNTFVRRGSMITTVLAGANRDPKVFTDPDRFDVRRENARDHLSFSAGRHFCLGAALARMEAEVGLRALYDRYPDLRLRAGRERRSTRVLRGFEHLPADLGSPVLEHAAG